MYQFSRSIFREIGPMVVEDYRSNGTTNRERVLEACEGAMHRLATDRRYFANPAKTLFEDVRTYFPINDQLQVYRVIEAKLALANSFLDAQPAGSDLMGGEDLQCRAFTRKGTACQRQPLPGRDYCPSHKHLEEPSEAAPAIAAEQMREAAAGRTAVSA